MVLITRAVRSPTTLARLPRPSNPFVVGSIITWPAPARLKPSMLDVAFAEITFAHVSCCGWCC